MNTVKKSKNTLAKLFFTKEITREYEHFSSLLDVENRIKMVKKIGIIRLTITFEEAHDPNFEKRFLIEPEHGRTPVKVYARVTLHDNLTTLSLVGGMKRSFVVFSGVLFAVSLVAAFIQFQEINVLIEWSLLCLVLFGSLILMFLFIRNAIVQSILKQLESPD